MPSAMTMLRICQMTAFGAVMVLSALSTAAIADSRRDEQDAARRARVEGQAMPFSQIKQRVDSQMRDATYVGSEFNPSSNRYRLKYMKDGKVVWVDADGRTGDITGWAR